MCFLVLNIWSARPRCLLHPGRGGGGMLDVVHILLLRLAGLDFRYILEEYMASYMRERGADAMLVLRNENKWAMTGNFFDFVFRFLQFDICLLSLIL